MSILNCHLIFIDNVQDGMVCGLSSLKHTEHQRIQDTFADRLSLRCSSRYC